ncbi:hypothetical protein OH77DRAFT_1415553 [Trametes cingulata]|nr:hypothetical protein OH77DRAFT_1415553 [Trametes cingulata]
MPELDTLAGFEFVTRRLANQGARKHKKPLEGTSSIAFPRAFAVNDVTCTVEKTSGLFDYSSELEPCPEDYEPSPHDARRAAGEAFARYLKPLKPGPLYVKARGKELIFAAGYHAVRVHFGLEGTLAIIPTSSFKKMILKCCPGNNPDAKTAKKMRSFDVPVELTVPEARGRDAQKLAVFAAIVGEEETIVLTDHYRLLKLHFMSLSRAWAATDLEPMSPLWSSIWSNDHGPDWIYEKAAAEAALDCWRAAVLSPKPSRSMPEPVQAGRITRYYNKKVDGSTIQLAFDDPDLNKLARKHKSIRDSITTMQQVFNGYGQHTANDLLHSLALWPGMSPRDLCRDDELYAELKVGLSTYASQFVTPRYRANCLSLPNRKEALFFNYAGEKNYINQYCQVYRKIKVRMPRDLYNKFVKRGLFNPAHIIGKPYSYSEDDLLRVNYTNVPVLAYAVGSDLMYSVILGRRPRHWRGAKARGVVPEDVRLAGFNTTIGPASFLPYKQNQYVENVAKPRRGRKAVVRTGKPGRPPRKHLNRKAITQQEMTCKAALAELQATTTGLPPAKRRKVACDIPPTDRLTRSRSGERS